MILTKQVVLKYIDEHRPANYRALGNCIKQAVNEILGLFFPCMLLGALEKPILHHPAW